MQIEKKGKKQSNVTTSSIDMLNIAFRSIYELEKSACIPDEESEVMSPNLYSTRQPMAVYTVDFPFKHITRHNRTPLGTSGQSKVTKDKQSPFANHI